MIETQLHPLVVGKPSNRSVFWCPDETKAAVKHLLQASTKDDWDIAQAESLAKVVRTLISPDDLLQSGQVEEFVKRFLENPNLRRSHDTTTSVDKDPRSAGDSLEEENWVHLGTVDEHANWIKNERHLLDLMGEDLRREQIVNNLTSEDGNLEKAVLSKRGSFVAVTDSEGRFLRLVDRAALIEKIASERYK
mgnify:CR=1 FL=1